MSAWEALGDRVVVRIDKAEEETASGIVLPSQAQETPRTGTVTHAGRGRTSESMKGVIPLEVKVGDRVMITQYGGSIVEVDGEELVLVRENDILMRADGNG